MDKIRVVIFGKQISSRKKLRTVLEAEPDFEIIGEAGSGTETDNYVVTRSFDILLFDLADPRVNEYVADRKSISAWY